MNGTNPKFDHFLAHAKSWQQELAQLRAIILDCKLTEELKWGMPCYTLGGANVVLVHVFKACCAVLFFKGALLKEAMAVEKSGLKVNFKSTEAFVMPEEFQFSGKGLDGR